MVQTRTRRDVTSGLSFIRKGWKKLTRRLRGGLQTRERHPDTDTNTYISFQISKLMICYHLFISLHYVRRMPEMSVILRGL